MNEEHSTAGCVKAISREEAIASELERFAAVNDALRTLDVQWGNNRMGSLCEHLRKCAREYVAVEIAGA